MKKTILVLFAFFFICANGYSQNKDTLFSLTTFVGGGYTYNVTSFEINEDGLNRGGWQGNLRVMWKPEYLISGGLEFGYSSLYSYDDESVQTDSGTTNRNTHVYTFPLMIMFSMPIMENWIVTWGTGFAFETVKNESFGIESMSTSAASTFMVSTAYYWPVMKDGQLGLELRGAAFPLYDDYTVSLLASFAYKFLEY
jgi:hypothetical protein